MNQIELLAGETQLYFDVPYENDLIRSGDTLYSGTIGVLETDASVPVFSGFFRHGFLPNLTGGSFINADSFTQSLGLDALMALKFGGIDIGVVVNHSYTEIFDHNYGIMGHLRYRIQDIGGSGINISTSLTGRTAFSKSAGEIIAENRHAYTASFSVSGMFPKTRIRLDASVAMDVGFDSAYDRLNLRTGMSARLGRYGSMTLGLRYAPVSYTSEQELSGNLSIQFRLRGIVRELGFRQTLNKTETAVTARGTHDFGIGELDWGGTVLTPVLGGEEAAGQASGIDADLRYTGTRFNARYFHALRFSQNERLGNVWNNHVQFQVETGMVFAGKTAAWTVPTRGSYTIVKPHESLPDISVGIPKSDGWEVRTDVFGPVAFSGYTPYRPRKVNVAFNSIVEGMDSGPLGHTIFPGYRSGYSIIVGTGANVMLMGQLLTADGTPVEFVAGHMEAVGTVRADVLRFFTTEGGIFQVEGLRPGKWKIILPAEYGSSDIVIAENVSGIVDVGDVILTGGSE